MVALAALIYYVFATEIAGMLALKKKDEEEDRPVRKKKVPNVSRPLSLLPSSAGLPRISVPNRGGLSLIGAPVDTWNGHDLYLRASRRWRCRGGSFDPCQSPESSPDDFNGQSVRVLSVLVKFVLDRWA